MKIKKKTSYKTLFIGIFLGIGISFGTATFAIGESSAAMGKLISFLQNTLMKSFETTIADLKSTFTIGQQKEGSRTVKAIGAATDAQNKLSVDLQKATVLFQSHRQENICESNESAITIKDSEVIRNQNVPVLGKPILEMSTGSKNSTGDISRILATHDKHFCGPQDPKCKPGERSNADLAAWNLLQGEGYDDQELLAAYNYMTIATNPRPRPALPKDSLKSAQGQEARSIVLEEAAHLSAAQNSYLNYIADRTKAKSGINSEKKSPLDIRQDEINRRWGNPTWVNDISKDSFAPAIKETALMMAYQLKQNEDQDRRFERIELLLATLVSIEARRAASEGLALARPRAVEATSE